jgi:hypothetical protein
MVIETGSVPCRGRRNPARGSGGLGAGVAGVPGTAVLRHRHFEPEAQSRGAPASAAPTSGPSPMKASLKFGDVHRVVEPGRVRGERVLPSRFAAPAVARGVDRASR